METTIRGIVVHPKTKKVLMCYYKNWKTYMVPGGHVDGNESDEVALKREMFEECGSTKIKIVKHLIDLLVSNKETGDKSLHKYYLIKVNKIDPKNRNLEPGEVIDGLTLKWVTPEEVIDTNKKAYYDSITLDNLSSLPLVEREIVLFNYLMKEGLI